MEYVVYDKKQQTLTKLIMLEYLMFIVNYLLIFIIIYDMIFMKRMNCNTRIPFVAQESHFVMENPTL